MQPETSSYVEKFVSYAASAAGRAVKNNKWHSIGIPGGKVPIGGIVKDCIMKVINRKALLRPS